MQHIEDFVRDLFLKTENLKWLTKTIMDKYLLYSQKNSLNGFQRYIFPDIIRKVRYEINIEEESVKTRTDSRQKLENSIDKKERQHMENFVRDLFSKNNNFDLLNKRNVTEMYLLHSQKDKLNPIQRYIFSCIIVKVYYETATKEESVEASKKQTIHPSAAQEEKSGPQKDGKSNSLGELPEGSKKMQPESLLSETGYRSKVGKTSLDTSDTVTIVPKGKEDVEVTDEKSKFSEFDVSKKESVEGNKKQTINPPAVPEEKSRAPKDNKSNSSSELPVSTQEMQPESLLSRVDSCQKVEDNTSLDANVIVAMELRAERDVEKRRKLFKNVKSTIKDFKGMKQSLPLPRPTKRILSKEILLNKHQNRVKKTNRCRGNKPSHLAGTMKISKHPFANSLQKLTNDKEFKEELPVKTTPLADQSSVKKQQKIVTKRLQTLEEMKPVLEDSNECSILSKSYLTDNDRRPAPYSPPACEKLPDKEDSLISLEEISDSTPTRCCLASKRLAESDSKSMGELTPPMKIKRIISSDPGIKNSSIHMQLFRNHTVDYPPYVVSATEKRRLVIKSDSETWSQIKFIELSSQLTGDGSSTPFVVKKYSQQKNMSLKYVNFIKADGSKKRKTVKTFRITISKMVIWKNRDSDSETESSPVIKEKKTKIKCKKKTSRYKLKAISKAFNLTQKQFLLLTQKEAAKCKTGTVGACISRSPSYATRGHRSL